MAEKVDEPNAGDQAFDEQHQYYRIRFRADGQLFTAVSAEAGMARDEIVMVKTDHGLEPAQIAGRAPICGCRPEPLPLIYEIVQLAEGDEPERFAALGQFEQRATTICEQLIRHHKLAMQLVRVEYFFNGSKIIFYFTADNRVDFRALVKDLVQEFRTRVEMRQVGVRHETKMIGGMGICGRELCCSSFIRKFDSVSIKMAKEQDLPLNPAKISGLCNRLLCCLTYEFDAYRQQRRGMPKPGRKIKVAGQVFKVKRQIPLQRTLVVLSEQNEERMLEYDQWRDYEVIRVDKGLKKEKKGRE
ncbi:MAG: stage 0 sporulation family protein [Desulfopila sp.]